MNKRMTRILVAAVWCGLILCTLPVNSKAEPPALWSSATALAPVSVLILEDTCSGSISYMDQACYNLSLTPTTVNDWLSFEVLLSGASKWDLVMVSAYAQPAPAFVLDALNSYLAAGGRLIMSDVNLESYAGHPLLATLGLDSTRSYSTPESVSAEAPGFPLFSFPHVITNLFWTDDWCLWDGEYLSSGPGSILLATYDYDRSRGAIVWSPGRTALVNGFAPTNYNDNTDSDYSLDILELLENEVALLLSPFAIFYTGRAADTVAAAGQRVAIRYFGGQGPADGWFFYRNGGALTFEPPLSMIQDPFDTTVLYIDLPPSILTARGLEYFFVAARGGDTTYSRTPFEPYRFVTDFTAGRVAQCPFPMPNGQYRIVGVPLDLSGLSAAADVITDDLGNPQSGKIWRLFEYVPALDLVREFPNVRDLVPGRAYWLAARGGLSYSAHGYSRLPNHVEGGLLYYSVSVDSGWSQVANPLPFAVDWDSVEIEYWGAAVTGHPDSLVRDTVYQYFQQGYATDQRVDGWRGFFVETLRDGITFLFRYAESTAPAPASPRPTWEPQGSSQDDWTVKVQVREKEYLEENFIGVRRDALPGPDRFDFRNPPAAPGGLDAAFRLPGVDTRRLYRTDYRPPLTDGTAWNLTISAGSGRSLLLTGLGQLPAGTELLLVTDRGHRIGVSDLVPVALPDDVAEVTLLFGTPQFLDQQSKSILPEVMELHRNYPNPFNPSTVIRFSLPSQQFVNLTVFNVLGRQVRVLAHGEFAAGSHDVSWDGTDELGREVGSGLYLYRLTSDTDVRAHKMLLLR